MAASGAIIAAAAASAAASAASAAGQMRTNSKIALPDITAGMGGEALVVVLGIMGYAHSIFGTLLDADDEWLVIRGRNGKHFLVPVPRVVSLLVSSPEGADLPRSA